jgi:signal transduction histidine kinase
MNLFNNLKISTKIFTVILIIAIGMAWFGFYAFSTLNNLKVNGPIYNKIVLGKDLVADILPPPCYLIESYLTVREMTDENDSVVLNQKAKYLIGKLKREYYERHKYWADNLPESQMKTEMDNLSYKPAKEFYEIVDKEFIPAIKSGNKQKAKELANGILQQKYLEHRKHIDNVTLMANNYCSKIESFAKSETRRSILMLIFIGLIAIASSILVFAYVMSRKITTPLKVLQKASEQVGEGDYSINLQVTSSDEIGFLTDTFNKMILKLKKQTVEIEKEKKRRLSSLIDGQEMERRRISRELHDGLGQQLIAIKLQLESTSKQNSDVTRQTIQEVKTNFLTLIEEVREISNNLAPNVLTESDIDVAIKNLCLTVSKTSSIDVDFSAYGDFNALDKKINSYIFRITQEGLNNAIKHSGATNIHVQLQRNIEYFLLVIEDNGKGFLFDNNFISNGNGLNNMKERALLIDGSLDIETEPDEGTTIRLKIPTG